MEGVLTDHTILLGTTFCSARLFLVRGELMSAVMCSLNIRTTSEMT